MTKLIVHGGTPLQGRIIPSSNKNAVLPVLCATLLTSEPLGLLGVPDSQVEAVSFGKEKPAAQGGTEDVHAKNRRAELSYR